MTSDDFLTDPARGCAPGKTALHLFTSDEPGEQALAKKACRRCPFTRRCFNYALERNEKWHIWGGVLMSSAVERKKALAGIKSVSEQVQALWDMRLSDGEIAELIGVNPSTVADHRNRLKLPVLYGARGKPLEVAA
jgi:hypothetical protein